MNIYRRGGVHRRYFVILLDHSELQKPSMRTHVVKPHTDESFQYTHGCVLYPLRKMPHIIEARLQPSTCYTIKSNSFCVSSILPHGGQGVLMFL